ncbi:hypothetical protein CMI37_17155 [Candidatus Pacearchaeota archaeon]|nr:hypothetical protein [Candidatus Pacearchaeota archaeon]|tara:strand:+ start:494 stop:1069 length:576 start_codon:yes stop_codon:yes gene_type:complete
MELESKRIEKIISKKQRRKEILEKIKKAGSEEYETDWDNMGIPKILKKKAKISEGRKSRARGAGFELKVRMDLGKLGWVVDKWSNNVDLEVGEVVTAKRKFNPFSKVMTIGTGFPDFIAFQLVDDRRYNVVGVEVKVNGLLSKVEKEKCAFLLKKKIFNEIWIAKKRKEGRRVFVEYVDFKERYGNKFGLG